MARERKKEYKPLSFSTTMRNPARIADFLKCILPFEGQVLTNEIIHEVAINLISNKVYTTYYVSRTPRLKAILNSDELFSREDAEEIISNSPQQHKEAGFEKGWPSRFDTWYKLPMEFGFIYYGMNEPIMISTTGHMLVDAVNEIPQNDKKIQNVFLNAMMKYQTSNPFRKNANDNAPLPLLLKVIDLLKNDSDENDAGLFRKELSLIICWPNNNANEIYKMIKAIREKYSFTYGDEVMYEICLKLLGATEEQKNRFKLNQITGEAVDEFIRKMRITGVLSLRGNGRFLDINTFESQKIEYILNNYCTYQTYADKKSYFEYMGSIDNAILDLQTEDIENVEDIKQKALKYWADNYSIDDIVEEINIVTKKGESKNEVLKLIDKPTRFEFLTSIALIQNIPDVVVKPNYHIDDEGLPTFTASGGIADIECNDNECSSLVEVTLMCARNQATNEMPAITRHLQEAIDKNPNTVIFSILVAPSIHSDSKYMAEFSKFRYNIDILTFDINEFISKIKSIQKLIQIKEVE